MPRKKRNKASGEDANRSESAPKNRSKSKNTRGDKPNRRGAQPPQAPPTLGDLPNRFYKILAEVAPKPMNLRQLSGRANVVGLFLEQDIMAVLEQMQTQGLIEDAGAYKYRLSLEEKIYEGILEWHKDGYAFVKVSAIDQDVVVGTEGVRGFTGDLVKIRLTGHGKQFFRSEIIEILKPARTEFVGTIEYAEGAGSFFIPQESKVKTDFLIHSRYLNNAQDGDKVVVELLRWRGKRPEGRVIRILGAGGEHEAEMHAIILEYGLPTAFPAEVQAEADRIPRQITQEEIANRRDFRNILTFTIDPFDAKDFDDALSFQRLENGNYEIGVHIADVTHYLQEGTALDNEAFERATSVYLVDRTLPMLPEVLSNDLCSLRPLEDRLTYSAVFEMDADGRILKEWFGRCVIHSDRRFTYEEVQQILETQQGEFVEELSLLNRMAYALRGERFAGGSINFETDEVKFRLDAKGKPVEVYTKVRFDAHKLIEDFMLLANRRVAFFVANKKPTVPYVYRIHATPDANKITALKSFVKNFGFDLKTENERAIAKSLNDMVLAVEHKPELSFLQGLAIRSMPKAVYTPNNIGHYGLGFDYYTHFTSPIRRYPDVLSHRLLTRVLTNQPPVDAARLEKACKHCSDMEKRAADAERASVKYKQVEYLSAVIGREFDGVVSGVTDWGMYVEIIENKCEGMISLRDLRDDMYMVDESRYKLIGRRTKKVFQMGDRLRIRVKKANIVKRIIDFELVRRL